MTGKRTAIRTEHLMRRPLDQRFPTEPTVIPLGSSCDAGDTPCCLPVTCRDRGASQHPTVHRMDPHKDPAQNSSSSTRLRNCRIPTHMLPCATASDLRWHPRLLQLDHSQQRTQRHNTLAPLLSSPPQVQRQPALPSGAASGTRSPQHPSPVMLSPPFRHAS